MAGCGFGWPCLPAGRGVSLVLAQPKTKLACRRSRPNFFTSPKGKRHSERDIHHRHSERSPRSCFRTCACVTDRCRQESTGAEPRNPLKKSLRASRSDARQSQLFTSIFPVLHRTPCGGCLIFFTSFPPKLVTPAKAGAELF